MAGETGREWKIYVNTGDYSTPVWTQVAERKDIGIDMAKEKIEVRRDGAQFVEGLKGYKTLALSFPIQYENGNTNMAVFHDDFFADDQDYHDLLILDGPQGTSGSAGIRAIVGLFAYPINASLSAEETVIELSFEPITAKDGGSFIETEAHTVS